MKELTMNDLRKRQDFLFIVQTTYTATAFKCIWRRSCLDLYTMTTSAAAAIPVELIPDDLDDIIYFAYALGYYVADKQPKGSEPSKEFPKLEEWVRLRKPK